MSVGPINPIVVGATTPVSQINGVATLQVGLSTAARDALAAQGLPLPSTEIETALQAQTTSLSHLIAEDAVRQDGLAPLFADLSAAASAPALPQPLRAEIQQLLSSQPALDATATAADVKSALTSSGLFLEAQLVAALQQPDAPANLSGDFKAQLLQLASNLMAQIQAEGGDPADIAPLRTEAGALRRGTAKPPPPLRGAATTGQAASRPAIDEDTDEDSLLHVLEHDAKAALARLELSQIASMQRKGYNTQWRLELPVATPDGRAFAQFEISRDGANGGHPDASPTWRTRFSLNISPTGPVHAEIAQSGGATRVTLWIDDAQTREALSAEQAQLTAALAQEGLGDCAVRVLSGAPVPPPVPTGALVDRST